MKHYVDESGTYLGQMDAGSVSAGAIEVPAPSHGLQQWDGTQWIDTQARINADAIVTLDDSDKKMARITEDIIDLLIAKGTISMEELPEPVSNLIADRKTARAAMA